ncbi:MAG: nitroreductase family deazaflavin-dependent oxidoreductase [Chloroflexota bacterium]
MIKFFVTGEITSWVMSHVLHRLDVPMLSLTKGKYSFASWLAGFPIIMLVTKGAKSGTSRKNPLVGVVDGDNIVIMGTNFGGRRNPSWYYNLIANPQATVILPNREIKINAREAAEEERGDYWEKFTDVYAGYSLYKKRASHRKIPIMVLTPAA